VRSIAQGIYDRRHKISVLVMRNFSLGMTREL
jgi:hypothetical protein